MSIQVTASRFALLCDDEDLDAISKKKQTQKQAKNEPKKSDKKSNSNSKSSSTSSKTKSQKKSIKPDSKTVIPVPDANQQILEDQFSNDLQKAILESQQTYENEQNQTPCYKLERDLPQSETTDLKPGKKAKKATKKGVVKVPLDEFLHKENFRSALSEVDVAKEDKRYDSDEEDTFSQDFDNWERCFGDPSKHNAQRGLGLASRYNVLRVEDDDEDENIRPSFKKQESQNNVTQNGKIKANAASLKSKTSKSKVKEVTQQWEEWKSIDEKVIDEKLNQDLTEALNQSKLDFQTRIKLLRAERNAAEKQNERPTKVIPKIPDHETNGTSGSTIYLNHSSDSNSVRIIEINPNGSLNEVQESKVESKEKDELILKLKQDNEKVKQDMEHLKQTNLKLREILKSAEMREKTKILIENEKIKRVNAELTEEVTNLHVSLEQERSKVHELQDKLNRMLHGNNSRRRSEDSNSAKH